MYNVPLELRHLNPSENSPNRVKCHKIVMIYLHTVSIGYLNGKVVKASSFWIMKAGLGHTLHLIGNITTVVLNIENVVY